MGDVRGDHLAWLDAAPVALLELDEHGAIAAASRRARELLAGAHELVGSRLADLVDEADRHAFADCLERGSGATDATDVRVATSAGPRWLAVAATACGDRRSVALFEVDDRKRFERALADLADRFEAFMDTGPVIGWMTDAAGTYVYANDACASAFGLPRASVVGKTVHELAADDTAAVAAAADARVRDTGTPSVDVETTHGVRGDERTWQVVRFPFWDSAGAPFIGGLGVDISAQRAAEQALHHVEAQLRQAQKMEVVGRLAGGVAHDFNNVLTVIMSYVSLVLAQRDLPPRVRDDLRHVTAAADRACGLTRQLLSFSRHQVADVRVLDLNAVLDDARNLLERLLGEDIELRIAAQFELPRVRADAGGIGQILMNLAVNARDAMPRGGTLSFETSDVPRAGSRFVRLVVRDSGSGMDDATRARIFEPFFTTKPADRGTGLGLSVVHDIVQQHGGAIEVASELGAGTAFSIYLPCTDEPASREAPVVSATARGGSETVLLVEDDGALRELAATVLRERGYRVLSAATASTALAIAGRERSLDLVLSDVVMPGMSGVDLWSRLCEERPQLRVLWMSGYTDDSVRRHGLDKEAQRFLRKPFTPEVLAARVREALDR
nr:response regulator [Kofleriaceae bacterium]